MTLAPVARIFRILSKVISASLADRQIYKSKILSAEKRTVSESPLAAPGLPPKSERPIAFEPFAS